MRVVTNPGNRAFSLVEVTLALGVAGFCLVAIFGLLPVALNSNNAAIAQTGANRVLSALIADLRATPPTNPSGAAVTSSQYSIPIPASGSTQGKTLFFNTEGQEVSSAVSGRYLVTINFPSGPGGKTATMANIKVSWPAGATVANAAGSVEAFVALDRN